MNTAIRNRGWMYLLGVTLVLTMFPDLALAMDGEAGTFSCSAGKAVGSLYIAGGSCPTSLKIDNLFSFLICNMEKLSSNVMGAMYCGIIDALRPIVWAAATLSVTLFGVMFMTGITQLSRGAAVLFLIKIAFVTGLALNADLLIGVGYRFLIGTVHMGSTIAISSIATDTKSASDLYVLLDKAGANAFGMVTDMLKGSLSSEPSTVVARCQNAVFAVLITMFVAAPMIGYLGLALVARLAMAVFSAVFGYIYALVGITFLMILAPFFLCFYLFKQTQPFFDKWIGYLASFTLQAILLFAFMSFVLTINISGLTQSLPDIIMHKKATTTETQALRMPWEYCTVCDFKTVHKDTNSDLNYDSPDFFSKSKLQCVNHAGDPNADGSGRLPITMSFAVSPQTPSSGIAQLGSLVNIGGGILVALIALAWMVEHMLKLVPSLAQRIAGGMGATAAPQLGGGTSAYSTAAAMPGEGILGDFQAGFRSGYGSKLGENTVSATVQGIKDGLSTMVTGYRTTDAKEQDGKSLPTFRPGIGNRLIDWMSDPSKLD